MQFILITTPGGRIAASLLKAAKKFGVEVIIVNSEASLMQLDPQKRYFFYSTRTPFSRPSYMDLERYITDNFNLIKLGARTRQVGVKLLDSFRLAGLPLAKTEYLRSRDPEEVDAILEKLGGFPIVVRAPGKQMRGRGIIKIDTKKAFRYLLDYLPKDRSITLQQYISHPYSARLIVLNNEIIASYCNPVSQEEFRSNVYEVRDRFEKEFSDEIKQIAIEATKVRFAKFAGVDVLLTHDMQPYLAEVNFPCNFLPPEEYFNAPVSDKIIQYFISEAEKFSSTDSQACAENRQLALISDYTSPELEEDFQRLKVAAKLHNISAISVNSEQKVADGSLAYPIKNREYKSSAEQKRIPAIPRLMIYSSLRDKIPEYVDKIGGYPVFIKTFDQEHEPYLYADNYQTLVSLCDYCWTKNDYVQIESTIDLKTYGGLVVLGEEVIASVRFLSENTSQFGVGEEYAVMDTDFSVDVQRVAVEAAQSVNSQFAFVIVLVDKTGRCFVKEVFDPFHFSPIQRATGVDIADKVINYLSMSQ